MLASHRGQINPRIKCQRGHRGPQKSWYVPGRPNTPCWGGNHDVGRRRPAAYIGSGGALPPPWGFDELEAGGLGGGCLWGWLGLGHVLARGPLQPSPTRPFSSTPKCCWSRWTFYVLKRLQAANMGLSALNSRQEVCKALQALTCLSDHYSPKGQPFALTWVGHLLTASSHLPL